MTSITNRALEDGDLERLRRVLTRALPDPGATEAFISAAAWTDRIITALQLDEQVSRLVEAARPFVEALNDIDRAKPPHLANKELPDETWLFACDESLTLGELRSLVEAVAPFSSPSEESNRG